eukprot:scaffold71811_cov66-Phaeocystis_antarctica.AAC.4
MWRSLRASEAPELADVSVTCSATPPYAVTSASADWQELCGFAEHEVVGKTLALIQGPASNQSDLRTMMASIHAGALPEPVTLINYDKQHQPFVHTVTITAEADASGATHLHARSSAVALLNRNAHVASVDVTPTSVSAAGDGVSSRCERLVPSTQCPLPTPSAVLCRRQTIPRAPRCPQGWGVHEVVTQATHPFAVVHASPGWLSTCGYRLDEIVGRDLSCIQGVATDAAVVAELMRACRAGVAVRGLQLVNYDKQARA